jgi:hypothetical protein
VPPGALSCPRQTTSLLAMGRPGGEILPSSTRSATYKKAAMEKRNPFSSSSTTATRASIDHHSTPISQSSNPSLVDYVCPENPLELTVLLCLVLQPKTHPSDRSTGSHRRPPPSAGELLPPCSSSLVNPCLMS